jgi:hypothetical protein
MGAAKKERRRLRDALFIGFGAVSGLENSQLFC